MLFESCYLEECFDLEDGLLEDAWRLPSSDSQRSDGN